MKHIQKRTRRDFIAAASLTAGAPFISRLSWAAGSPLQKLQYAAIGVGGRGAGQCVFFNAVILDRIGSLI